MLTTSFSQLDRYSGLSGKYDIDFRPWKVQLPAAITVLIGCFNIVETRSESNIFHKEVIGRESHLLLLTPNVI